MNKGNAEKKNRPAEPIPANWRTHARNVCKRKSDVNITCSRILPRSCGIDISVMSEVEVKNRLTSKCNRHIEPSRSRTSSSPNIHHNQGHQVSPSDGAHSPANNSYAATSMFPLYSLPFPKRRGRFDVYDTNEYDKEENVYDFGGSSL
jgi:hypothetical protein